MKDDGNRPGDKETRRPGGTEGEFENKTLCVLGASAVKSCFSFVVGESEKPCSWADRERIKDKG
jgi:hypothetical protein